MVFHSTTPRVDFETQVDWQEKHKMLKAGFDTTIYAENARHDIQFGHLQRATHQNLSTDRARFEVCNHKWTDLSDACYGIAVLNDCKYGFSVLGGDMRLTLLKSGTHPDYTGDPGLHSFNYALLPHIGGFSVENVTKPAYEFNVPVVAIPGCSVDALSLASVDSPNIIIEAVKWAEDGKALIIRLYEAGNARTCCKLKFGIKATSVKLANMLEEEQADLPLIDNGVELEFHPFEIKTLRVEVG
jgi:alpha-mannosidase